jgi:hypothetical protein
MKKLITATLALTMVLAGSWALLSLYRWEWTRALWMTIAFVVAEVALVGLVLVRRLQELSERLEGFDTADPDVRARLAESRPSTDHFAWLRESATRTNVFVTMILGGGVLISGVLWIVDKVAGQSVTTSREGKLALQLSAIAFPRDGLVPPESSLFAADLDHGERDDLMLLLTGRSAELR